VKTPKKRVLGKDSTQVGFSVEKDLVTRIDQLARRDCISRSTWMREALIHAWRDAREFKRTPIHGYLATPIETIIPTVEKPKQTPKKRKKA
jgi:metal-responsive CopG/Arc/MetJ family transcriptional regulator